MEHFCGTQTAKEKDIIYWQIQYALVHSMI